MTPLNQVVPTPQESGHRPAPSATREMVVAVIAEVTRYPPDILVPEAHLEDELGIDSVKRAEILAVLASRFNISPTEGPGPAELRTVGDVVVAIDQYLAGSAVAPAATVVPDEPDPTPRLTPAAARPVPVTERAQRRVVDIIAQVTRYPREILVPGADLQEDLGFDAAQRSAIVAALGHQFGPFPPDWPTPSPRTIGDVVAAVERWSNAAPATARPAAPVIPLSPTLAQVHPSQPVSKPFAGRIALVTGSGHGLGKAFAMRLASLGATVAVNSFHSRLRGDECVQEIVAAGGDAVHLWGSVANQTHLSSMFGEIKNRFGGLDFFISNASNGVLAPLADVKPDDWDKAFRTNVVALHQGALMAAELMKLRGGGKIVAMSTYASQRYVDYFGCMGPIKSAVECLVRYLAIELGEHNIQVNALTAGPVYGELLDKWPESESLRPRWEANVPRGRLNTEDEVADAMIFLLTNTGMNGSSVLLDAGGSQRIVASPEKNQHSPLG